MFYHEPRSMPVQKRDRKTYQHRKNLCTTNGGSFVDEKTPAGEEDLEMWSNGMKRFGQTKERKKIPTASDPFLA